MDSQNIVFALSCELGKSLALFKLGWATTQHINKIIMGEELAF